MDQNLAYMLLMKKKAAGKLVFTRENLENYGAKVSLFPGVEDGLNVSVHMERDTVLLLSTILSRQV